MSYFRTAILLAALTALFMGIGFLIGGQSGMIIALLIAGVMNLFTYWNADKMVLSMYGAHEVDERQAPELYALVRQLAANAGLPMPRVYIMENPQPNAFATGRNSEHAAVAVTTGLMQMVNRDELAGVLAHELGHVKHRDTLLMTLTATIAGAISMLANFGFYFGGAPRADGDQPHARIRGRPRGRRDLAASVVARLCAAQDRRRRRGDSQHSGRAQSRLGASLHRQPAVRRGHGQSVLDPSQRREPNRAAERDRPRDGPERPGPRRRSSCRSRRDCRPVEAAAAACCRARALGLGPSSGKASQANSR